MALTQKQLKDVCYIWGGDQQCRYLDEDLDNKGNIVYVCKKKSPDSQIIDIELSSWLKEVRKKGQDPHKQGVPLGDNCKGYIKLTNKQQGYDVKGSK